MRVEGNIPDDNKNHPFANSIIAYNNISEKLNSYSYGESAIVEEPIFIARKNSFKQDDGWLIHTLLDCHNEQTHVAFWMPKIYWFRVCSHWRMNRVLPLGFYGYFVGAKG